MRRAYIGLAAIILFEILILFIGCQGDNNNPIDPGTTPGTSEALAPGSSATEDLAGRQTAAPPPALWGLYEIIYNAETHEITSVPLRGPTLAFNVVPFLQPPMGSLSGMTIGVLDDHEFFQTGRLDIRVILHHPFPGEAYYTGFDVCGIFMTEGTSASNYNASLTHADPAVDPVLLNPDGYTRWMNPTEFLSGGIYGYEPGFWGTSESSENSGFVAGATLNPYKYFAQGFAPDGNLYEWIGNAGAIEERGIFRAGAGCGRDYHLDYPVVGDKVVFVYNYAVLANWAEPLVNPPMDPIDDFPPEANAGWPLHIFATDNSNAFYTDTDAGGSLALDLEVFDWGALQNPEGIGGEVGKIVLWCEEPLIPGNYAEFLSTEVEWNSGFTASTSVASVEVDVMPESAGEIPVWIEIQSANPAFYNQDFGVAVPTDSLAAYHCVMVDIKTCPKASTGEVEGGEAGSGEYLNDVVINGENFVEGPDLGLWLSLIDAGGEAGIQAPYNIYATDVQFISDNTITADFDLNDAPFGDYGLGCTNGCGTITEPEENFNIGPIEKIKVKVGSPINIALSTGREGPMPQILEFLTVSWTPVPSAQFYRIYARFFDVNGNALGGGSVIGVASDPELTINLGMLPNGPSGAMEIWVTALPSFKPGEVEFESKGSVHAYIYMQDFETGLGLWETRAESSYDWRFIRSSVDCAQNGAWGLKSYGESGYAQWVLVASPQIPEIQGADTARIEFNLRYRGINENDGFQVGWLYEMPEDGNTWVEGYYPIPTVSSGHAYNDTNSNAMQVEFGCTTHNDNNWQYTPSNWQGWFLSALDISEILGDEEPNYIVIGGASEGYGNPDINFDDVAILVF